MHARRRLLAAAPLLVVALALAACAAPGDEPAPSAPSSPPAATTSAPSSSPAAPSDSAAASPEASAEATPDPTEGWETVELGLGDVTWRMPAAWSLVPEDGMDGPQDYSGIVVDGSGTPMLSYGAVVNGQYATDYSPCERPSGVVVLDEQSAPGLEAQGAQVVVVLVPRHDASGFHAGISALDAHEACEPGILAIYPSGLPYSYITLQIVDDAGTDVPVFRTEGDARAYMETDEYRTILEVLRSATVRA